MTTSFTIGIDWDADDTFTDETAYLKRARTWAGFAEPEDPVAGVGRCTLVLDNGSRRFSPGYTAGALYGDLLPRRAVRITATDGVTVWTLFRGVIESIQPDTGPYGARECVIECVDGVALLERQQISVEHAGTKAVDEAVSAVVSAAYTPPATEYADNGDELDHYGRSWNPEQTTALDALRDICRTVYGRFWVARDGTATYWHRGQLQDPSAAADLVIGGYWETVLDVDPATLEAYWRLNETSGTTAADSSGNGRDVTVTGVTWGQTGIGDGCTAAGFDGVNDLIDIYSTGLRDALDAAGGVTVSWWVRVSAYDGVQRSMTGLKAGSAANLVAYLAPSGVMTFYWADGVYRIRTYDPGGSTEWIHVAAVLDKTGSTVDFYINGVSLTSQAASYAGWSSVSNVRVGVNPVVNIQYWLGDMAHVAIWSKALNSTQIALLAGGV
ncbi:MAG: LamG domain-containing protein [Anaerolineae bacterium]|nr:LamG domain-containing protein [Anaerolineae bacterium]